MSELSSYLKHLPAVLWTVEVDPSQFLGRWLRIFEKMLTGLPDEVQLRRRRDGEERIDQSIEELIDRLPDLFDPWRAPKRFLPFLARCVGLDLPADWDEERSRRAIERIVGCYQQRWLRRGLHALVDLFAPTNQRPRIAIDDGEAVLKVRRVTEGENEFLDVRPIAFARPAAFDKEGNQTMAPALTHPVAIAIGKDSGKIREYVVADAGRRDSANIGARLWRLSPDGDFLDWDSDTHQPISICAAETLADPCAVIFEETGKYLVLDRSGNNAGPTLYRYELNNGIWSRTPFDGADSFRDVSAADMVSISSGQLVILDLGNEHSGGDERSDQSRLPQLLVVTLSTGSLKVVVSRRVPLQYKDENSEVRVVTSPTCLAVYDRDNVLVADAGKQVRSNEKQPPKGFVGNVFCVNLGSAFTIRRLLDEPKQDDPWLIYPSGVVACDDRTILVIDKGHRGPEDNKYAVAEACRAFVLVEANKKGSSD